MTERVATIREVPDAVKHDCWVGIPLWMACVRERGRILDVHEGGSEAECRAWLVEHYPETQRGSS